MKLVRIIWTKSWIGLFFYSNNMLIIIIFTLTPLKTKVFFYFQTILQVF